jgi:hypothetical protein
MAKVYSHGQTDRQSWSKERLTFISIGIRGSLQEVNEKNLVKTKFATSVVATLASGLDAGAALAQTGAEFFDGKAVQYIVATDTGGGYDMNGRPVAQFMQKHFPGSTVIARSMPGAGHIIGVNDIYLAVIPVVPSTTGTHSGHSHGDH